ARLPAALWQAGERGRDEAGARIPPERPLAAVRADAAERERILFHPLIWRHPSGFFLIRNAHQERYNHHLRIRLLAVAFACAAVLCGQRPRTHRFSWQDYCFDHPAAPFCKGNDYAVKNPPMKKDTQQAPVGEATPYSAPAQTTTPSVV